MKIPEDYIEFLYWLKAETEKSWEGWGDHWATGAKWVGLDEHQIEGIETKYEISFSSEHKEFLKILHSVDRRRPVESYDENDELYIEESAFFYNWLHSEEEMRDALLWPYQEILEDVKNGIWLKSWGKRPDSSKVIENIFSEWYNKAPKLLPVHAHRFVVSHQGENPQTPVLSVWGADTIVYGWSMKHYLLNELEGSLNLSESDRAIVKPKEVPMKIPYWSELINSNV